MIERIVLDGAPDAEGIASRLRLLRPSPALEKAGDGPNVLWVTESSDRAREAIARGSRAWTVGNTGELQRWEDLPLAVALADGTLAEVRRLVGEGLQAQGLALRKLAWTADGAAAGEAEGSGRPVPVLVTAGPDGEDPQIHVGDDAETMARERGLFTRTLVANGEIARGETELAPGQTHTLDAADSHRPRLERRRFSL